MLSIKEKISTSLIHQFILCCLVSFLCSLTLYLLLQHITFNIVEAHYSRPDIVTHHYREKVADLQRYIFKYNISSEDTDKLYKFVKKDELLTLAVYTDELIFTSHEISHLNNLDTFVTVPWNAFYKISFTDKNASLAILYQFKHIYKDYVTTLNMTLFFILNMLLPFLFIKKKILYVLKLNDEVNTLKTGNLNYPITTVGSDELSVLSSNIDALRQELIKKETHHNKSQAAHNELIASISHDLRTPLTTLSGYLDILASAYKIDPTKERLYLGRCKDKTIQLKILVDELFQYFFISSKSTDAVKLVTYDNTDTINTLMLTELDLLASHGFSIKNTLTTEYYSIAIDRNLFQRLMDNLITNIIKYGDIRHPIKITNYYDQHTLIIKISNTIRPTPLINEINGLGLKICSKIISLHGGNFHSSVADTSYITHIELPVK